MASYCFDGSMTGLLSCVFRAFEFKEFNVIVTANPQAQTGLFDEFIRVASNDQHGQRVWQGLKQKVSSSSLRAFYYTFLSEQEAAFQTLFDFAVYVFQNQRPVDKDYGHTAVIGMSQWAKQVGREKHRMEAFVRFKKAKDGLFLSLVRPDFNVLPIISRHFQERYQDQSWLIYDEQRNYGIYYDLRQMHQVEMNAEIIDPQIRIGHSQSFSIELDDQELLYDQLWKDYFNSVNIQARKNMKLHIQYVPKRYWRYMNEKLL
ncbi:putative DNA metabolism protein [Acinetobacter lwoffii]|uniref:DNA metabolism protein n=1 Tax=Acinetobacter lwoffii TaxID=28090 RepID=A0AAW8LFT3_ACILW|nr:TIGR03915 family putative DNA repair protein [Acinetobacter lwoffii]MDR6628425.1 putative DNA metabolism protein [Acinetobacter lwoffii]